MTDLDAHVIVTHMGLDLRDAFQDFILWGRLGKDHLEMLMSRGLISIDSYGCPELTEVGKAAKNYLHRGDF